MAPKILENCTKRKLGVAAAIIGLFVAVLLVVIIGIVEIENLKSEHRGLTTSRECQNGGTWSESLMKCENCRYFTFGQHCEQYMKDCEEGREIFYEGTEIVSKMLIKPNGSDEPFFVRCRFEVWGAATYIVTRFNTASVNFNRSWEDFKYGFGDFDGTFFVGLEYMHRLTQHPDYILKIHVKSKEEPQRGDAHYINFRIKNEAESYSLHYDSFYGDEGIGDAFALGTNNTRIRDSPFCTYDKDCGECAATTGSGWWFNNGCSDFNLHLPMTETADHLKWVLNDTIAPIYMYDFHLLLNSTEFYTPPV